MSALLRCHGLSEDEEEKGEVERDTGNSIVVVVLLLLSLHCHVMHCIVCHCLLSVDGEVR